MKILCLLIFVIVVVVVVVMQMAFLSSLLQVAETLKKTEVEEYRTEFFKLVVGTLSVPIDLPGTNYRYGVQVNTRIMTSTNIKDEKMKNF